jgi:hypothetical protein
VQAAERFDEMKHQLCTALRDEAMTIDRPSSVSACAHFSAFAAHVGDIPPKLMKPDSELARLHGYLEAQVRRLSEDAAWSAAELRARRNVEHEVDRGSVAATARKDAEAETVAAIER